MKPLQAYVARSPYLSLEGRKLTVDLDALCDAAGLPSILPHQVAIVRKLAETCAELLSDVVVTLPMSPPDGKEVSF